VIPSEISRPKIGIIIMEFSSYVTFVIVVGTVAAVLHDSFLFFTAPGLGSR
jgi:hypothetical protein